MPADKSKQTKVVSSSKKTEAAPSKAKAVAKTAPAKATKTAPVKAKVSKKAPVEEVEEVEEEVLVKTKTKLVAPTREGVMEETDTLISLVEQEITKLRDSKNKSKGIKFLRSLNKKAKTLRSHLGRVLKQRQVTRKPNTNSGFLKPVNISVEMAKFTGRDPDELVSRVAITNDICKYIKDHNLQNPKDRREIEADSKLSALLKYDSDAQEEPLTYFRLQKWMKDHFIKTPPATA